MVTNLNKNKAYKHRRSEAVMFWYVIGALCSGILLGMIIQKIIFKITD